eukprot:TRINITY_DN44658_c0_g1_i1.p1 TRINITY_DN44658_c0_g1~~TRINITY_DN44658_c0_g1_i1.p1  ORF type:complete len:457 (+),score=111.96 TRINITY_DN44658_c0_g1_i1:61-1431(+)
MAEKPAKRRAALPVDLIQEAVRFLPAAAQFSVAAVCREFRAVVVQLRRSYIRGTPDESGLRAFLALSLGTWRRRDISAPPGTGLFEQWIIRPGLCDGPSGGRLELRLRFHFTPDVDQVLVADYQHDDGDVELQPDAQRRPGLVVCQEGVTVGELATPWGRLQSIGGQPGCMFAVPRKHRFLQTAPASGSEEMLLLRPEEYVAAAAPGLVLATATAEKNREFRLLSAPDCAPLASLVIEGGHKVGCAVGAHAGCVCVCFRPVVLSGGGEVAAMVMVAGARGSERWASTFAVCDPQLVRGGYSVVAAEVLGPSALRLVFWSEEDMRSSIAIAEYQIGRLPSSSGRGMVEARCSHRGNAGRNQTRIARLSRVGNLSMLRGFSSHDDRPLGRVPGLLTLLASDGTITVIDTERRRWLSSSADIYADVRCVSADSGGVGLVGRDRATGQVSLYDAADEWCA